MNHKHYTFWFLDNTVKETLPSEKFTLFMFLKAKMQYYVAEHKLQDQLDGSEKAYLDMLVEEYAA